MGWWSGLVKCRDRVKEVLRGWGGAWYLLDYKADGSFWHQEEWYRGKNRCALTPLGRIRCLRWSVIEVWSGLKLPLSDSPRLMVWLTFSNSSAQKRAGLEMLFHSDGSAELRTGVLDQLSLFFSLLFYWRAILTKLWREAAVSLVPWENIPLYLAPLSSMFSKTIQAWEINWWQSWWVPVKSCCLCLSGCPWCLHAQTGDIWPAWG